ncbi:MAG: glycosyltransferase [Cyanobacteria bacterium P01_H01_bin.58]
MPLISVVMPAYNAEKTIAETVQSVLDQTLGDFELIIVNDGSTDGTLTVLEELKDDRIQIHTFPNSGPQKSRNRGIERARGDYIAFLDSDDLWKPAKLADQLEALKASPGAALAYSWTDWIDEHDRVWRRGSHVSINGDALKRLLLNDFIGNGSNPLVLAEAIKAVGGFDEAILGGQDWEMWLRIASQYPIVAVSKVQILYRKSSTSRAWSNNVKRQEKGFRQVVRKTIQGSPEVLKPVQRKVLGNVYKSLTVDLLERASSQKEVFAALRFISLCIWYDPSLLKANAIYKALARAGLLGLFPPKQYRSLVKQLGQLANAATLYGYLQLE